MKLEYIPSNKEANNLTVKGYIYQVKQYNIDGTIRWRCKTGRKDNTCSASVTSDGDQLKVLRDKKGQYILPVHTHNPVTATDVAIIMMKDSSKKQARSSVKVPLKSIINNETHKIF